MPPPAPSNAPAPGAPSRAQTRAVHLLVRVADAAEAAIAAAAGVDMVETDRGAAGVVRAAFPGRLRLRLDHPTAASQARLGAKLAEAAALGADEVSCDMPDWPAAAQPPGSPALVARLPLSRASRDGVARLRSRADAIVFEVAPGERLFDLVSIAELDACAQACRAQALPFGISGSLEAPDVARLLLLGPDVLGFDCAVRVGHRPDAALDPFALCALRDLIPHAGGSPAQEAPAGSDVDQVFVRDFVVPLSIGAYRAERNARQRVRFSVEAEVAQGSTQGPARVAAVPRDMRDVFSYDIIIETIRMLAERPHVAFVETLAEEVAASLLMQPRLLAVTVTVEKLDVVDGSVGVRIHRRRQA